jgi:uncharacterized protein (UPF0332 family)
MKLDNNDTGVHRFYLDKAERALSAACILLTADNPTGVCDRAYYAMFDAAHAALLIVDKWADPLSVKTHGEMIAAFRKHLVQSGLIDIEYGRFLNQVHQLRQYSIDTGRPVSIDDAALAFDQAHAFIAVIKAKLLPKQPVIW